MAAARAGSVPGTTSLEARPRSAVLFGTPAFTLRFAARMTFAVVGVLAGGSSSVGTPLPAT